MKKIYLKLFLLAGLLSTQSVFGAKQTLVLKPLSQAELPQHHLHHFPNALRTQYLQLDFSRLNESDVFTLDLFDGKTIQFSFKHSYQYKVGSTSWYGQSTTGSGDVIFSFYQGNIKGTIKDDQMKKYMLQQINLSNMFALTEVNVESMQETPDRTPDYVTLPEQPHKKTRANADVCAAGTSCGGASTIDLMVLGNADAVADAGGNVAALTTDASTAITEMNTAYTNSGGTLLTFDLVHCDLYAFTPTANSSTDLSTFRNDPAVVALRDLHYADLAGLWVGSGTYAGICGIGYLNTSASNYSDLAAYTVTDYSCSMTNLSYAHECGHNMGLRHDYYVDGGTTPCDHHHGYVNQTVIPTGLPIAGRWRTIMAYNNECSDNGFGCTRLARWSNPNLTYSGDATGRAIGLLDPAYEIYGFERFRCVVADFRTAGIPLPLPLLKFSGLVEGKQIRLQWETRSEFSSKGFEVEMRRSFSDDFAKIGFVDAKGQSNIPTPYQFGMNNATEGTYYFRLKQIDRDNQFTYSQVIRVDVMGDVFQTTIYPNPAKDLFHISFYTPNEQKVTFTIYDLTGKRVKVLFDGLTSKGNHVMQVNSDELQRGVYFCEAVGGSAKTITKLLIE